MARWEEVIWAYLVPKGIGGEFPEAKYVYTNHPKWDLVIVEDGEPEEWGYRKLPGKGYELYSRRFYHYGEDRKNPGKRGEDKQSIGQSGEISSNPSKVQSILFDRKLWTLSKAKKWLKEHGYKTRLSEKTQNYYWFRQEPPKKFERLRMIDFGENTGIKAIVGFTEANKNLTEGKSNPYNYSMVELFPPEHLEKRLKEAKEFKEKGDIQQSCEKLYSVVESLVKILAEKENVKAYHEAISGGGWNTRLLGKAAAELDEKYSKDKNFENLLKLTWNTAYVLHREGFHENRITIEDFENDYKIIMKNLPKIALKAGIKLKVEP